VDDTTATLVLKLHISDIEELSSISKGKGREGERSDADLALLIYQDELKEKKMLLTDRRMARSLTQAVLSDAAIVTKLLTEEDLLAKDRAMAHDMAGTSASFAGAKQVTTDCGLDDSILARLATLYVPGGKDNFDPLEVTLQNSELSAGESSAWASSRKVPSTTTRHQRNAGRLVARANQVVARDPPRAGVAREQQVDRVIEHLRERHHCEHGSWRYVPGPHQCEECYYNLPQYIFECRQCRIMACNRCRRNRL
jgi:hypothetical protein